MLPPQQRDYLGGGQGQVVAKSCHFFDSNEVKCIHHPISQKSGDFVIFFTNYLHCTKVWSGSMEKKIRTRGITFAGGPSRRRLKD